jgi:hypothetical protein
MPLNFEPRLGSAVDTATGLTIYAPRILPASPPEDPEHTEYQYSFYLHGKRIDGLGFFGTKLIKKKLGHLERIFELDLGRDWVLDSVFEFKKTLDDEGDNFVFLQSLARGLVGVFEKDSDADDDFRYLAMTNANLLERRGIVVPNYIVRLAGNEIILAEIFVAANSNGEDVS